MFMRKTACCVSRVVDSSVLPTSGVWHNPLDYPEFYDPLYYRGLYPRVFASPALVCLWLSHTLPVSAEFFGNFPRNP